MCKVMSLDWKNKVIEVSNGYAIWSRDFNETEIMQSTGLKDKNGVEIYEGDVVKVTIKDAEPQIFKDKRYSGVVAYRQGAY